MSITTDAYLKSKRKHPSHLVAFKGAGVVSFIQEDAREVARLLGQTTISPNGYDVVEFNISLLPQILARLALLNRKCVGLKKESTPFRWIPCSLEPPSDISCFTNAHKERFACAMDEFKRGRMLVRVAWFMFPRMVGKWIGESLVGGEGLRTLREARMVLKRKPIGKNLREVANALLTFKPTTFRKLGLGCASHIKASSTLFANIAQDEQDRQLFNQILVKFFGGEQDDETISAIEHELNEPRDDTPKDLLYSRQGS